MRQAVLIPGRRFGPWAPLLMYAGYAAVRRGAELRPLVWDEAELAAATTAGERPREWVGSRVEAALREASGSETVVIGKSLASFAAREVADRSLPAVWLTPLLREADVLDGLRAASAPFLLVGGSADREAWDGDVAAALTPHWLEVPDADHALMVPGPLAGSAAVLGQVTSAVEAFLDRVAWAS